MSICHSKSQPFPFQLNVVRNLIPRTAVTVLGEVRSPDSNICQYNNLSPLITANVAHQCTITIFVFFNLQVGLKSIILSEILNIFERPGLCHQTPGGWKLCSHTPSLRPRTRNIFLHSTHLLQNF